MQLKLHISIKVFSSFEELLVWEGMDVYLILLFEDREEEFTDYWTLWES